MTDKDIRSNILYYGAFFEAMFWADIDESEDIQGEYYIEDIHRSHLARLIQDLDSFFNKAGYILDQSDYTHDQACHDFYFTRQGHGVGFWENDHCNEKQGQTLTDIAQGYGPLYISENEDQSELYIE